MNKIILALVLVFALAGVSSAQTTINNTTLTNAITATTTVVTIASATCTACTFGPGTLLYIDNEALTVGGGYVSGTTNIPVLRGQASTRPAAHAAASVVFVGPPQRFHTSAGAGIPGGDPPIGACTRASQQFLPWINTTTGAFWTCDNYNWRVLYNYQINNVAASRPTTY
jgi:hypothetical protein